MIYELNYFNLITALNQENSALKQLEQLKNDNKRFTDQMKLLQKDMHYNNKK